MGPEAAASGGGDVRAAVRAATERIADAQVGGTAALDAELVVGHVAGLDRAGLRVHAERVLGADEQARIEELVRRRASGEPVAYLLGTAPFRRLMLDVDARVLVPRPETELLVEVAIEALRGRAGEDDGVLEVVDACTGSGCVALAIADEAPAALDGRELRVRATELDPGAAEVARANARRLDLDVEVLVGDLLEPLGDAAGSLDVLVANPPYVALGDAAVEPWVHDHEPHLALYAGGDDPLAPAAALLAAAPRLLRPGGTVAIEHGEGQGRALAEQARRAGLVAVEARADLAGIDRLVVARRPA